jgi:hypothetical protein
LHCSAFNFSLTSLARILHLFPTCHAWYHRAAKLPSKRHSAMNYYFTVDGKTILGPCPATDLATRHSSGELPATTQVCAEGAQVWQPIHAVFASAGLVPPPPPATPPPVPVQGDATGGIIPYKNAPALIAYYLGIFGLIPLIGLLLAIPAFILGIIGLRKRAETPAVKGAVHACDWHRLGFHFHRLPPAHCHRHRRRRKPATPPLNTHGDISLLRCHYAGTSRVHT